MGKSLEEIEKIAMENLVKRKFEYVFKELSNTRITKMGLITIDGKDKPLSNCVLLEPKKLRELLNKNGYGDEVIVANPYREDVLVAEKSVKNYIGLWGFLASNPFPSKPYAVSSKPFMIDKDGVISEFSDKNLPKGMFVLAGMDKRNGRKFYDTSMNRGEEDEDVFKDS